MNRYRLAVLIFVVGASLASVLAAWSRYRAWGEPLGGGVVYVSNLNEVSIQVAMREAIILTIGGVAWFLLPGEPKG